MSTQIIAIGNATAAPELRVTRSGTAATTVSIAVNKRVKDENAPGGYRDGTVTYYEADLWNERAKNAAASIQKGDRLVMTGSLVTEFFTSRDGSSRSKLVVEYAEVALSIAYAQGQVVKNDKPQSQTVPQGGVGDFAPQAQPQQAQFQPQQPQTQTQFQQQPQGGVGDFAPQAQFQPQQAQFQPQPQQQQPQPQPQPQGDFVPQPQAQPQQVQAAPAATITF